MLWAPLSKHADNDSDKKMKLLNNLNFVESRLIDTKKYLTVDNNRLKSLEMTYTNDLGGAAARRGEGGWDATGVGTIPLQDQWLYDLKITSYLALH